MFVKNGWYAANWSKDLGEKPVARTIIEDIVLFRGGEGKQPLSRTAAAIAPRRCRSARSSATI